MINELMRWERFCVSYSNPFYAYVYECHNEVEWTVYIKICTVNGMGTYIYFILYIHPWKESVVNIFNALYFGMYL